MPGETYTVVVAIGFLLCLVMIPLSLLILDISVWIFIIGSLIFFVLGFLASTEEEETAPEFEIQIPIVDSPIEEESTKDEKTTLTQYAE